MISEALASFEQGVKRFPREPNHYIEYARLLLKLAETGESDQATESKATSLLKSAIEVGPSQAEPHYQLGNLWLTKGRAEEALSELEIAAKLDPNSSKIRYSLTRTYRRLGREKEASEELQAYYKLKAEEDSAL